MRRPSLRVLFLFAFCLILVVPSLLPAFSTLVPISGGKPLCPSAKNIDYGSLQLLVSSGQFDAGEIILLMLDAPFSGTLSASPSSVSVSSVQASGKTTLTLTTTATVATSGIITISGLKVDALPAGQVITLQAMGPVSALTAVIGFGDGSACRGHIQTSLTSLDFGGPISTNPPAQVLTVSDSAYPGMNMGVSFLVSPEQSWLTVTATAEVNGVTTVTVSVDFTGLNAYTGYYSMLYINATNADNAGLTIPIRVFPGRTARLNPTPTSFSFKAAPGVSPPSQTLLVNNSGSGNLYPQATVQSGTDWLQLTPVQTSETSGYTWTVSVDSSGLGLGTYDGSILVQSNTAYNTGLMIPVHLVVENPTPTFAASPSSVNLTLDVGSAMTQTLNLTNSGTGTLDWTVSVNDSATPWLTVSQGNSKTMRGFGFSGTAPSALTVSINTISMSVPGTTYTGTIHFESPTPNVTNPSFDVPVTVKLLPRGASAIHVHLCALPGSTTAVTATVPLNSTAGLSWTATATGFGGGANWLALGATSGTTPGSLSITANPTGLSGTFLGAISVAYSGAGAPTDPQTIVVDLTVGSPSVNTGGVVNAASSGATGVVPGSILTVYGVNLASSTKTPAAGATTVPDNLGGATVYFGSTKGRIYYASPTQLNVQVPPDLTPGTTVQLHVVVVDSNGTSYDAYSANLNVIAADPGLFTVDNTPTGAVLALNTSQNWAVIQSSAPAQAGDVIVLYGTALGAVSNPPPAGQLASTNPLSELLDKTLTVTIGGKTVQPAWTGLAPNFAGLYQINLVVPAGVQTGSAVPVKLTVGGKGSNTATIALK